MSELPPSWQPLDHCLACGGDRLIRYLDLGMQPLANSFHDGSMVLPEFPLGLNYCPSCWHSQNLGVVHPDLMFKSYPYVSGTTATLKRYFSDFADRMMVEFGRGALRVLDIASNDGSLLYEFKKRGHIVLGVDPAENIVREARKRGIPTVLGYWDYGVLTPETPPFDLIVAMNVLGHVADPLKFLQICDYHLKKNGKIVIQTSQAMMLKNGEFDTCYHEHVSFFTASSFRILVERAGLGVTSIDHVPVHGISYLIKMAKNWKLRGATSSIDDAERNAGYYDPAIYEAFAKKAHDTADEVCRIVEEHRTKDYNIIGYGAAAKAMTFLNYAGFSLDAIIDDNPLKVGKLTPGGNIPIISLADMAGQDARTLFLILSWNFKDEIMRVLRETRTTDDRFLTYFPNVVLE